MSTRLPRLSAFLVILLLVICANAQQNFRPPLIRQPIDESRVVTLKGNTHPLAKRQFDMGVAPPDLPMDRMLLVLRRDPQQDHALHRLLDDQQDKNSSNYHKWMTPSTFGAQFGASDQDIQLVVGWLQTHGFQINHVSNGRTVIEFSGVESQVEQAFHTQIHQYALPNGEQHWANASDPQIPAAMAAAVAGVWSLHDFKKKTDTKMYGRYQAQPGKMPLFTSTTGQHALMPADYAVIYNLNPLYTLGINGQNTKIAVVARSDFNQSDVYSFRSSANLPGPFFNMILNGPDPGIFDPNEEFEADLDVTWSGAVASNATVDVVISASTNTTDGVDLSELYIIDNNVGDIMTESFSGCEGSVSQAEAQAVSALAEQAAAEGITYMVSAGDSGAEGCVSPSSVSASGTQPAVNVLASTPYTVAVGGTMFNENNNATYWNSTNGPGILSAKSYIPENVWNESCVANCGLWSGGGGTSAFFSKPTWQFGVSGIPADGVRDLPDVSLAAAGGHDPYLLCFENSCFYGVGGTSASAPSFAGIMALVVQQNGRQGAANYILYRLAASETLSQCNASSTTGFPNSTCVFNDVTKGNNAVPGELNYGTTSAKYQAGVGYDLATGLGSVNANNLVTKWNTVNFNATQTTLGPSAITATHGSPVTLNIAVAPSSGSGVPTGDVSLQTGQPGNANPAFLTLSNGSVSTPLNNLPGGAYTMTARYGGDSTYAPSTSSGVSVNISPENSKTALSVFSVDQIGNLIPLTSGTYGGFVYLSADVSGVSQIGSPTGNVAFVDNNAFFLGALSLNSQGQTSTPTGYFGFSVGQHSLAAQYSGDLSFNTSTSAADSFTITKASSAITVQTSSNGSGVAQGTPVTFTATVASPAFGGFTVFPLNGESMAWPSGSVTFISGNTQLGSAQPSGSQTLTGSGVAVTFMLTLSSLPAGVNSITAQYRGDSNYLASSASPVTVTVDPDFTISPANNSVTVAQGGSATEILAITGQTGYSNTVDFTSASCSGLPNLTTCSFNPSSVVGSGTTTVTIKTSAPSSAALHRTGISAVGFIFAAVLLMGVPARRYRAGAALSVILCLLAIGSTACGGGSGGGGGGGGGGGSPGTTKGSYTVVVTATTSDHIVSHAASFTLTVQ